MEGQLTQLDKEAARQQELLYNAEFEIQQIERKIARGLGERSDEEKNALKKGIEKHERLMEEAKEKRKVLQQQTRKLLMELAQIKLRRNEYVEKVVKLKETLGEKELEVRDKMRMIDDDANELDDGNDDEAPPHYVSDDVSLCCM